MSKFVVGDRVVDIESGEGDTATVKEVLGNKIKVQWDGHLCYGPDDWKGNAFWDEEGFEKE